MSVFTNPASSSAEQAKAYTAAVLALVAGSDPLEVLASTPRVIELMLAERPDSELTQPESPGRWSVREALQHLADAELVWGFRLRMVIAHDRPPLAGYDQDLFATRLRYEGVLPGEALEDFAALRRMNLRLWNSLSDGDLNRVGVHAERGEENLGYMLRLCAGHDIVHVKQIERILG